MTIKHINNDYTITFYESANKEYKSLQPSSSLSQSVTKQTVTQSVLNNYTWINATGANHTQWAVVSGTSQFGTLNPNNSDNSMSYSQIGTRVEIRNNQIFTNVYREAFSEENNGIAIYDSSSSGWSVSSYINIPTSSVSNGNAAGLAREFSLHSNYMTVGALDTNNNDSKLYIYKSSSSGWAVDSILTTSSYNAVASSNDTHGDYAFLSSKIHGNKIFANGFRSNSNRYVGFFKSSSASGWALEKEVQVEAVSADYNASMGISGVSTDFDGTTAVMGSKDGAGSEYWHNASGKVHIFKSSSSGWREEAKLGLLELGLTSSVTGTFGSNYGASEYRTWSRFGYKSCVVSGNYIAAAAQGQNVSVGGTYQRQRHSVFILKSSSAGWKLEARINDPASNLTLSHSNMNSTNDTEFGTGLRLQGNVLVVNSSEWMDDWSSSKTQGRSYVYVSSAASGWALDQTIDNPYSGSAFESQGSSGRNMQMGYNGFGGQPNAGALGYGSRPAIRGNLLVLNHPNVSRYPDVSTAVYGAVLPLYGSGNYVDKVTENEITESVKTTTYNLVTGATVPARLGLGKGTMNIRGQSSTDSYTVFRGDTTIS